MSALSIQPTYPIFTDIDGQPLEDGYVWIGTANLDPQTNQINVYWDAALTLPAAQPIRTLAGYPANIGTPARLYVNSDYSIRVMNKNGSVVYSAPAATERYSGVVVSGVNAEDVIYDPPFLGGVQTNVEAKLAQAVSVKDFGAVGDGVTDDTAAIQAALDYGAAAGVRIIGIGTFRISSKVVIKGDADFSQAVFNVYSTPAVAVEVSTGSATDPTDNLFNAVIWLPRRIVNMTKPSPGWSGQGVGVRTVNTSACQIFVGNVVGFARGLLATSFGAGNSYNNYYLGHLENNEINLDLTPGNSGAWVNENNFIGGRLSHYSSEGTNVAGTRHIYLASAVNTVNNNLFIKPSIEGDTAEFHVQCAGSQNTFQQARWEATTPKLRFFGTNADQGTRNIVLGGYDLQGLVVSSSGTSGGQNSIIGGAEGVTQMGVSGKPLRFQNQGSSASAVRLFYGSSQDPFANGADWSVFESSQELRGKRPTDTYPRIKVDYQNGLIYFDNGATASPTAAIGAFGAGVIQSKATFWPGADNTLALGNASYRWSVVYAGTGTINTSDEREKQDIADLDAAEKRVATALKGMVKKFRFKDAVQAKGDGARIHVGVTAQEVTAAFQSEGLDPMRYAIVCYDEWEAEPEELDEEGNVTKPAREAGNRYGIRYEELLAFIVSAL